MHLLRSSALLLSAVLSSACAVEFIDDLIAQRGVTECSTSSGDSTSTSSTGTSSTGSGSGESGSTETSRGTTDIGETSMSGTTQDTSDATTGAPAQCGNLVVEAGEECDELTSVCNAACIRSRYIFVTSEPPIMAGAVDGLIGADYQCRHRAAVMGLANAERYRAWISTSTVDARDRVEHHPGRYILVNGLVVAEDWDEFVSGAHQNPIDVNELSETLARSVWTATRPDGTRVPGEDNCQDWTSSSDLETVYVGDSSASDASWTLDQVLNPKKCGNAFALYCIEQS